MKKFVFISGLHRSGTSILHRVLSSSKTISGFTNTGVPEDEGQHLQSVYPAANFYGGPGIFALNPNARLDETSSLITEENRAKLLLEWGRYWNMDQQILIEKSPPNIIKTRFLQKLFPEAFFITITRHPVAVSLATKKWSHTSLDHLLLHWITAHQIYEHDRSFLKNEFSISYEELVKSPEEALKQLSLFLDAEIPFSNDIKDSNTKYFNEWTTFNFWNWHKKRNIGLCIEKYEEDTFALGYSLIDLKQHPMMRSKKS